MSAPTSDELARARATTTRLASKGAREDLTPDEEAELTRARAVIMSTPEMRAAEQAMWAYTYDWMEREGAELSAKIKATMAKLQARIDDMESAP